MSKRKSLQFVVLMGLISLFADMTYEGARSIIGPYLALFGASGVIVGFAAGFGEFVGYCFRLVSGYISDKTGRYWFAVIIGYVINLLAVPFLALAGNWQAVVGLMIAERFGKAVRNPAGNAMLSYATKEIGRGWGFGLHEALDQIGAILGPSIVALILFFLDDYPLSFAILAIPAILALAILTLTRLWHPHPEHLEMHTPDLAERLTKPFWIYVIAVCFIAAGTVDFALISYHFKLSDKFSSTWIPILFAIAMGVDGIAALFLGRLFDKMGMRVLMGSILVSSFFAPFVFLGGFASAVTGMVLWGIGMGSQESIMRAALAKFVGPKKRGTAYGMLSLWFGLFWFAGSAFMGFLYDVSIPALVAFSLICQFIAIGVVRVIETKG